MIDGVGIYHHSSEKDDGGAAGGGSGWPAMHSDGGSLANTSV